MLCMEYAENLFLIGWPIALSLCTNFMPVCNVLLTHLPVTIGQCSLAEVQSEIYLSL